LLSRSHLFEKCTPPVQAVGNPSPLYRPPQVLNSSFSKFPKKNPSSSLNVHCSPAPYLSASCQFNPDLPVFAMVPKAAIFLFPLNRLIMPSFSNLSGVPPETLALPNAPFFLSSLSVRFIV